jgi:long-chain acyl-CoA synthetase
MITAAQAGPARKKASAGEELPHDETGKKVMLTVRAFTKGEREIGLRDNLELDAGLDSLSKIELTVALEKVFSVKLPENFMADVHTVEELADAMRHFEAGPAGGRIEKTGWKEILSVDPEKAVALERPDAFMAPSRIMHGVLRIAARILFRLEAQGAEHIPAEQGCIITPNHTSYLDGFVVVLSLPFPYFRRMYSLGISDFFTGLIKSWFARIGHVIPIDSASYLNKALQTAAYVLRHGRSLCVFPEGGRSADGTLMEFKKGVGILAIELGVPVVPALIEGAYEALPRGSGRLTPGKIRITYGKPLRASDIDFSQKPGDLDEYQYFVNVLREKVRALKKAGDLSGT